MTAPATERVDLAAVERDIAAVLVRHGLAGHDHITVTAHHIIQGGQNAGVTISAFAHTRPAGLPTSKPTTTAPFTVLAERIEAAS